MHPSHETTVMSVNLRFGLADDGENAWEKRRDAFSPLFQESAADFIGMQEANNFQTKYMAKLLRDYRFIGVRNPSPSTWQNNLIFYQKGWVCQKSRHYFLSETPHEMSKLSGSKWPRQCVMGHFSKPGKELVVITTHFDFDAEVQKRSAELVLQFLKDFPDGIPVVLTGDFNAAPQSLAHDTFRRDGFIDSFDGNHSSTFHGFTGNDLGEHIDWILFKGKRLEVASSNVIKADYAGVYPTDHYPVLSRFRWKNGRCHGECSTP